jgi:arylsulfatase A-like enzyme
MNIVFFMSDTYRRDNLSCYGSTPVKTHSLDRFAGEACIFENAYLGSFPTIPNRLDIMSGRFSFIDREWSPLPEDMVTLQRILTASGVVTYMIADNPHLLEMGFNFGQGFNGFEWIRGQETDLWKTSPKNVMLPNGRKNRSRDFIMQNYLRNVGWWKAEEDRFVARTVQTACQWLEDNQDQDQFFLYIDAFDPHEPWDAPQKYLDLYETDYTGEEISYPHYDFWQEFLTEEELRHYHALYMAEASMVDHWFGVLLDKIDELGLKEDTAVVFLSDHGFLFGEHDLIGKSLMPEIEGGMFLYEAIPMYEEVRHVPLLIRLPEQTENQRIRALVQHPDLLPTILEMAGLVASEAIGGQTQTQLLQCGMFTTSDWEFRPEDIHGRSLMPLMHGETDRHRDVAVSSNTLIHHSPVLAKSAIVTEDGWCLHYAGSYDKVTERGAMYTNVLRDPSAALIPTQAALYYLPDDPQESNNVIEENQQLAREIHQRYVKWLEEAGTSEEHLAGRRELR